LPTRSHGLEISTLDRRQLGDDTKNLTGWKCKNDTVRECDALSPATLITNSNALACCLEVDGATTKPNAQGLGQRRDEPGQPSFEGHRLAGTRQQTT
jgi:hypothetical protein